jgi:hypothetical protein
VARGSATKDRDSEALEYNEEALIEAAQMGEQEHPGPTTSAAALLAMDWDDEKEDEAGERIAQRLIREKEERPKDNQLLLAQADFRRKVAASQEDAERLQAEQEENAEKKADAQAKADADAEKKRQSESR